MLARHSSRARLHDELVSMNQARLAQCAGFVREPARTLRALCPSRNAPVWNLEGSHEAYPRSVSAQHTASLNGTSCHGALGLIHPRTSLAWCLRFTARTAAASREETGEPYQHDVVSSGIIARRASANGSHGSLADHRDCKPSTARCFGASHDSLLLYP